MGLRTKSRPSQRMSSAQKRVSRMSTPDLISWADQALFAIGRNLSSWDRDHDTDSLDEAVLGAESLAVVVAELRTR